MCIDPSLKNIEQVREDELLTYKIVEARSVNFSKKGQTYRRSLSF